RGFPGRRRPRGSGACGDGRSARRARSEASGRDGAAARLDARPSGLSRAFRVARLTDATAVPSWRTRFRLSFRFPEQPRIPMSWFDKLMPSRISTEKRKRSVPEGLWVKCTGCSAQLYRAELKRNLHVCPKCNHHLRIGARERLE